LIKYYLNLIQKKTGEMKSNPSIKTTSLQTKLPNLEIDSFIQPKQQINGIDKPKNNAKNPFTVVAIGASAGGLEAITQLLQNVSPTTGMAFIYVQHLSPDHKSMLSSILSKKKPKCRFRILMIWKK